MKRNGLEWLADNDCEGEEEVLIHNQVRVHHGSHGHGVRTHAGMVRGLHVRESQSLGVLGGACFYL